MGEALAGAAAMLVAGAAVQTLNAMRRVGVAMKWTALIPLVLLPGCLDGAEPTFGVSGSFTADRTQADIEELAGLGREYHGSVVIAESSPEQFIVSGMRENDCEDLYAILLDKPYVDHVGACNADQGRAPY